MVAMLQCCGEHGYRRTSVQKVVDRSGSSRSRFYSHFENKTQCFAEAYCAHAEALCERLLRAGEASSWRLGLERALLEAGRFIEADFLLARGLLLEVHVAGEPVLNKRQQLLDRLAGALDRVRLRVPRSAPPPPSLTATFLINTFDAALARALMRNRVESFAAESVPALVALSEHIYLDQNAGASG